MDNSQSTRLILGSLRYKSAPEIDYKIDVPLTENIKTNVEFDRSNSINLQQLFDEERQTSTIFRPSFKFNLYFKNSYVGISKYKPFQNNFYLVNTSIAAANFCTNPNLLWTGYPQYNEFDFIRTDFDVSGYTQPPNEHIKFVPKSASTYNWGFYVSYPVSNDYNKYMEAIDVKTNSTLSWIVGDGIPFIIESGQTYNGQSIIRFRSPVKHGLTPGEFVKLNFSYLNQSIFEVYTLGDDSYTSEDYIFNIFDVGYTGTTFQTGTKGTLKRVLDINNSASTISKYYVRKQKIISDVTDSILTKAGFEQNIFGTKKKFESAVYTPDKKSRVSILDGSQSYTLTFNKDFDLGNLLDNHKRPIMELFVTVLWKGYFGWTTGSLKQGFQFNIQPNVTNQYPNPWWSSSNSNSNTNFTSSSYTKPGAIGPFYYVNSVSANTIVDGDYCEWNDFEQSERVVSELYHKFKFNPIQFTLKSPPAQSNPFGYYYQTHFPITLRVMSDYIETAPSQGVVGVPNYATFSTLNNEFRWRDIYSYGFIDYLGNGVDYPFFNGKHYPFKNINFRIIPEGTNYTGNDFIVVDPLTDECE